MKRSAFVVFFSIFLVVYSLINFYIWLRGWQALASAPDYRTWYSAILIFLAAAWLVGRFLERREINRLGSALVWIGSFWLGAMAYFYLFAVLIDLIRLANYFLTVYPSFMTTDPGSTALITLLSVSGIVFVAVIGGHINALIPRIRRLDLEIPKYANGLKSISIAAASDIHLGTIVCRSRLAAIIEKINTLDADLVLLPGDVIDEDLKPVIRQNLGEVLRGIKSKYGVFASTGNHEYIGGVDAAMRYLTDHGIIELRDRVVMIADAFYLAGRDDLSSKSFGGKQRGTLEEILSGVDKRKPIILMDHQPYRLEQAEQNGVDVQLSGHTHHGQLWPFNYITKKIYEVSRGYKKKGNTHIYVSCGVGTWGPPIRTGNTPEVMHVILRFTGKEGQ